MYSLWQHISCPNEGQINELIHESIHKEIIEFMYTFYKKKYPNDFYSMGFIKQEDFPF